MLNGVGFDPSHVPGGRSSNGLGDGHDHYTNPVAALLSYEYADDGRTAAHLIDWIGPAHNSSNPADQALANSAANRLFALVGQANGKDGGYNLLTNIPGSTGDNHTLGARNPAITAALGETAVGFIDRFAADPDGGPTDVRGGDVQISEGDRIRIFSLIATDPKAAEALSTSVQLYEQKLGGMEVSTNDQHAVQLGNSVARIDSYLEVGVNNGLIETGLGDQEAQQKAAAIHAASEKVVAGLIKDVVLAPIPGGSGVAKLLIAGGKSLFNSAYADATTPSDPSKIPINISTQNGYGLDRLQYNTYYGEVNELASEGKITAHTQPGAVHRRAPEVLDRTAAQPEPVQCRTGHSAHGHQGRRGGHQRLPEPGFGQGQQPGRAQLLQQRRRVQDPDPQRQPEVAEKRLDASVSRRFSMRWR
uniref:hypothetical protein n=1 Tax=Fodinicola feengrottensis TaxID=435914 RepID=UPI0013D30783|nr:hypothetical protein [Fodinicola feengrottensis]